MLADAADKIGVEFHEVFGEGEGLVGVEAQRENPDPREVRSKLSGMGSLSDLWLEPSQDADLARAEAHEKLRKLVARLDRLTADPLEPTQPRRMLRVGQSSSDLEGEASATNEAVRFGSSRVRWEPIDGFVSPGEYRSFVSWITDRLADGRAEEVEVEANPVNPNDPSQ